MSHALLQHLINLTALSSAALLLILLLRPLLRRHGGAALVYGSWWLLPLTIVASALPTSAMHTPAFNFPVATIVAASSSTASAIGKGIATGPMWLLAWSVGAALSCAWMVWQQVRFMRSLGWLRPGLQGSVYFAVDNTQMGPLLLGLLRPRIVLPADFDSHYTQQEQTLIVAHEQVHLQRYDALANGLASAFQIVFWFNPLLHYAVNRFRLDQELACDAAVLQQFPQARQDYANAILKTQLFSGALPLACHWQSHHPLKERIMQLSKSTPSRARHRSAMAGLATIMLATCYGVWAAEQVPANAASSVIAADAPRYEVAVNFKREVPGSTNNITLLFALRAGEIAHMLPDPKLAVDCTIDLSIRALPNDQALLKMPFRCSDDNNIQREPGLQVNLGQTARVGIGKDVPGIKFEYTLDVTINHWPESKPWPKG